MILLDTAKNNPHYIADAIIAYITQPQLMGKSNLELGVIRRNALDAFVEADCNVSEEDRKMLHNLFILRQIAELIPVDKE